MFEGDSADTCGEKFSLVSMGLSRAQTRERGPPSALAELLLFLKTRILGTFDAILLMAIWSYQYDHMTKRDYARVYLSLK